MTVEQRGRRGRTARGEWGGSRFNFILIILIIALGGYSAYQYVPVAYNAYLFKDYMQEMVNKAAYPPGQTNDWVASQLRSAADEYHMPKNMQVNVQNEDGHIAAHVQWAQEIQLPGFAYEYKFDNTARSSGFINPK
ncbi:MAG TPA: hypothetical protein VHU19_06450 [Pyrinomonadaceae bacterium]|jgi:hypothetical protein|nr:hypothetical protein [Pyrinomonadaceae bacterium]